jgi:predicted RNA-binding protein with PIN domain
MRPSGKGRWALPPDNGPSLIMILIDGYNVMYAHPRLRDLMSVDLESARDAFVAELIEYAAREDRQLEVVFDGRGTNRESTSARRSDQVTVTFSAGGKTADSYIEEVAYRLRPKKDLRVIVVTGDYQQQKVVSGAGVIRMSSREFFDEVREAREEVAAMEKRKPRTGRVKLEQRIPEDTREALRRLRERRK